MIFVKNIFRLAYERFSSRKPWRINAYKANDQLMVSTGDLLNYQPLNYYHSFNGCLSTDSI